MKSTLSLALSAIVVGVVAGVALGYWEARPWAANAHVEPAGHGQGDAASELAPGEARAVVPETTFKFGNMETGTTQRHAFPIRNEGDRELTINYVSHTCKCTGVRLDGKEIEPGANIVVPARGASEIELKWIAPAALGPFRHGASFQTNDPGLARMELTVEGEIVGSTTLEPSTLSFGTVHVGQPARAELVVMAFLEPEVSIISHEVLDAELAKRVKVEFEPVPQDKLPNPQAKAGVKVIATYDPEGTVGPMDGSLSLETNIKKAPILTVPLYGVVKGDIAVVGPPAWVEATGLLRLGQVSSATGHAVKLFVNVRGDRAADTKLTVGSVSPAELKATLGEPQTLREGLVRVPLVVEIPAGTRPMVRAGESQGGEGAIELETTNPDTPRVRLRVTFTVLP